MGFKIKASDGTPLEIEDGEYYFNTKPRCRRMMQNSLSADARRVYACLELATMSWKQELAVTMEGGERRPLTPTDIRNQTGLSRQHVRRGLEDLEEAGLAIRKAPDGGALRKGQVLIYSWAVPREPKEKDCSRARLQFPDWFPESWAGLTPLINRFKYRDFPDIEAARGYFQEGEEIARGYQKAEIVAIAFLDRVCAQAPHKGRKNVKNLERKEASSSSAVQVLSPPPKAEEEDAQPSLYQKFKAAYPGVVDDAKAKPAFEKKTKAEQAYILERLQVYVASDRWRDRDGQFIPFAGKWLGECQYDVEPPRAFKKAGTSADRPSWDEMEDIIEQARAKERAEKAGGGA